MILTMKARLRSFTFITNLDQHNVSRCIYKAIVLCLDQMRSRRTKLRCRPGIVEYNKDILEEEPRGSVYVCPHAVPSAKYPILQPVYSIKMSSGFPLPNPPFFSFSSVPSFLAQVEPHDGIGKHSLRECHDPDRPKVSPQKRPRILASERGNTDTSQEVPWHRNDLFIRKFDQQELRSIVEPQGEWIWGDLTCPIHTLLHSLVGITSEVPLLNTSLYLATRFLSSRHTLAFFYNLITAPVSTLKQESRVYHMLLYHLPQFPKMAALTKEQRMLTITAMVLLKPHISIASWPDTKLNKTWAYTERVSPPEYLNHSAYSHLPAMWPMPAQSPTDLLRRLNFTGTNAMINYHHTFRDMLHPHTNATSEQRMRAAYMLAITLIHELAHAVYICRFPALRVPAASLRPGWSTDEREPFFGAQRKPELGHALETCLFDGGKILSLGEDPEFKLGLGWQRWPDVDDVGVKHHSVENQSIPLVRIGSRAPKWETVYAIKHEWIRRQFDRGFWKRLEGEGLGTGLLTVDKDLGSRRRNYDFIGGRGEDGFESGASSKGRGPVDGVVRPGQELVESEPEDVDDDDDDKDE
jgi:hypothetical protein